MSSLSRRQFVRGSAAATAALTLPAFHRAPRRCEELRVGVVGLNGRGQAHINSLRELTDVRVVALCDVDARVLARSKQAFTERGEEVDGYADVRRLLEREDLDAVSLATPDHLHALHTIWACQAGKHVYVEAPISHNLWEGGRALAAAEKYRRVVQCGTQARSSTGIAEGIAWLRAGNLGEITHAWGTCFRPRKSIGRVAGPVDVPEGVDWPRYRGPRGVAPLERERLHGDWRWSFDTGCGDLGSQGVHQLDLCRWGLGQEQLPSGVLAAGGRFGLDDDGETPNSAFVYYDYDPAPLVFEVRGLPKHKAGRNSKAWKRSMDMRCEAAVGAVIHAEEGYLLLPNDTSAHAFEHDRTRVRDFRGAGNPFEEFVGAVRAGDAGRLSAPLAGGHLSSGLCHMGNDSYRCGAPAGDDAIAAAVAETPLAREAWARLDAHLTAHEFEAAERRVTLGAALRLDPTTETYIDHDAANALRRGTYVEGFEVSEEV